MENAAFEFPEHQNYIILVNEAQRQAKETRERVHLEWRGFRDHVDPDEEITATDMAIRLHNALQNVTNLTQEETQVK